jgi:putative addiction module antidote
MTTLKLTQIGNSVGGVLPKVLLARLNLARDDWVFLTDAANGVVLIPYVSKVESQMAAARILMKKRRNTLRELAK